MDRLAKIHHRSADDHWFQRMGRIPPGAVANRTVLLIKSGTHLDYPGKQYLNQLIGRIISHAKPTLIISVGTAGGA